MANQGFSVRIDVVIPSFLESDLCPTPDDCCLTSAFLVVVSTSLLFSGSGSPFGNRINNMTYPNVDVAY